MACTFNPGATELSCVYTPNVSTGPPSDLNNCTFSDANLVSLSLDKGTFALASGVVVSAYRELLVATATLTCANQTYTNATLSVIAIKSNDMPSNTTANFCGGTAVFSGIAVTASDGTPIFKLASETTGYRLPGTALAKKR